MSGLIFLVGALIIIIGIIQLPLLFDLIRSCAPNIAPKRLTGPVLDSILSTVMLILFTASFHLYFWCFLPAHLNNADAWLSNAGLLHIAFFWWVFLNTVSNYLCAVFTPPGNPPKVTITPNNVMSISIESCIPKEKICPECKCIKADTTHHCSVCKACVLHMDHHCPFVLGCVGLNNYHYFYTFMLYFYVGMIYSMYLMYGPFVHCHGMPYQDRSYECDKVGMISILLLVVGFNMFGGTLTNAFNLVALISNTSTMSCLIESLRNGLKVAAKELFSQLSLSNLRNPRSRLHVVLLSKRQNVFYFILPPVLTAVQLFVKNIFSKKRTIHFKFPKMPKKSGLIA